MPSPFPGMDPYIEHPELVTAIEILLPVNKQSSHEAYLDYLRKRRERFALRHILWRSTSCVEASDHRSTNRPHRQPPTM